ncbi:MAG: FHA domain-containing protein [Sorangiineae bacterium]|nr:FHA domain-containing protein [Sorangiineae bacterium]
MSFEGDALGEFWPIRQGQNVIGRKGAMDGLDIELDHATTSSRHATLYASARPGRLKLDDPGSTNGTFLNEQRLDNSKLYELKDGDQVRFGGFVCVVKIL